MSGKPAAGNNGSVVYDFERVITDSPRILYCHCHYAQVVPTEVKETVLRQLAESGVAFDAVADLCEMSARHTRGCVVLERPDLVKEIVVKHGARDTTVRGTAMAELEAMTPRLSCR